MMAANPLLGNVYLLLCRGMDVYNKHFCNTSEIFHDDFYTKSDITDAYSHYVATVVKRLAHETAILGTPLSQSFIIVVVLTPSQGWELANDPRCSSGLSASDSCSPQTITSWTATIAEVVKRNDPNHLVSVG